MSEARTALAWMVAALAIGCFDQVGCPECLVTIHVRARDGGPVPDVAISYDDLEPFRCEVLAEETSCTARPFSSTSFTVMINAPGYQGVELDVDIPGDPDSFANCECTVDASVVLEPL